MSNQIRQLTDNKARETYNPDPIIQAFNGLKNKLPYFERSLPEKVTSLGKQSEVYQNSSNSLFNVLINPGFNTTYQPTKAENNIMEIYRRSGEKVQFPRMAPKKFEFEGKPVELTPDEYAKFQKYTGDRTEKLLSNVQPIVMKDKQQEIKANQELAKQIQYALTAVNQEAKMLIMLNRKKR
jgi:hypothetical protein